MTAEQQYRSALRWYPRSWRKRNEDVMVGTLLDVADRDGRDVPTRGELRDLRRSGLAARADAVVAGSIRDRVAGVSLGAGTALALALLTGQAWARWAPTDGSWPQAWLASSPELRAPDGIVWQLLIHPAYWVVAAMATLAGWTVIARILLVASVPVSAIALFLPEVSFLLRPSVGTLAMMAALALVSCIGRPPRPWLLGATAIMAALLASWLVFVGPFAGTYFPRGGLIDFITSPVPALALFVATFVFLARRLRVVAAAVLVAAGPWLAILLFYELWLNAFAGGVGFLARTVVVGLTALTVPVAIALVARRYARPPWLSPSESSDSRTSASRPSSTR
ncbi:MAG TPA: hypothetical protein VF479_05560 [Pseudolysinimonas sp.]